MTKTSRPGNQPGHDPPRARRREGARDGEELPHQRRERPLRRHRVPPRHQGLHGPGRRLRAGHEAEADRHAIQNEASNGLKNDQATPSRWRAPRRRIRRRRSSSSTRADNAFLDFKSETAAGLGLRRVRQGGQGHRSRRRDRAGPHRQPRRPRRRAARRRDHHARDRRLLSPEAVAAHGVPAPALPLPEATPTLACPTPGGRSTSSATCTSTPDTPRRLRRLGGAPAAHAAPTPSSSSATCSRSGSATTSPSATSRRAAPRCWAKRPGTGRSPSWPATATSWSATPCSRRCGVMRLHDPTLLVAFGQRVLVSHGDALCLGDVAYQRYRAHRPPSGACSAPCWRCRCPWRQRHRPARRARRAERRKAPQPERVRRCRRRGRARLAARQATRRCWCTATPTRRRATRSGPGSSATC